MWRFKRRRDDDFRDEVEAHLAHETDRLISEGLDSEDAAAAARRAFGNVTSTRERFYESRRLLPVDQLRHDVRYALRTFRRFPGFAAVVTLTLALGIGANTAIFSVVNALILRPLPYRDADRLVRIAETTVPATAAGVPPAGGLNAIELQAVQANARTLTQIGIYRDAAVTLTDSGETTRLQGVRVSPVLLSGLGIRPFMGRTFDAHEENDALVVLAHATWQRQFAGDPGIVGRTVMLEGRPHVVIGVMPAAFAFPDATAQLWMPVALPTGRLALLQRMVPLARLEAGVSAESASVEIAAIVRAARADNPPSGPAFTGTFRVSALQDHLVAPVRPALRVLTVAVGFVLLIACVNVANLLLARRAGRHQEIAVRFALGASRARLVRQLITESGLLAIGGGIAGTALAMAAVRLLTRLAATLPRQDLIAPPTLPGLSEIGIDGRVLMFTLAITLVTALVFGLAPALLQSSRSAMSALRRGRASIRPQRALVVAELALAMMLLVGGGLLAHSFVRLSNVNPGYDASNVLTFTVVTPPGRYDGPQLAGVAENLTERFEALPEVRAAGYTELLPMVRFRTSGRIARGRVESPPSVPDPSSETLQVDTFTISRHFLDAMGIRVNSGRGFDDGDGPGAPRVALINRTLARTGFFGGNPIGQQLSALKQTWEIVGIVDDVQQLGLDQDPVPQAFFEMRQTPAPGITARVNYFVVRTAGEPAALAPAVRSIVRQLDPETTVDLVAPMDRLVSNSLSRQRLYAVLLGIFAALAVVLAAIGMYGVMSYAVAQRRKEIGVRMALGAQRADVMRLVVGQGLALTALGVGLGLTASAMTAQYLEGLLFGLTPLDPVTFVGASALFLGVAALASYLPARGATKVDPLVALRLE